MKMLWILLIFLSGAEIISAQDTLTLNRSVNAALEHNHNIQISEIDTEKAANRVTRGNAGQMPSLSVTGGASGSYSDVELVPGSFFRDFLDPRGEQQGQAPSSIRFDEVRSMELNAALGTQFVIYDGMKGRLRYKNLETTNDLADLQHLSEMENTILSVTRRYLKAVSLQEAIRLKELALEQSRERFKTMDTRREYGQVSEQERLQALADLKSDSTEYRSLNNQFENFYRELHSAIGWERREVMPLDEEIQMSESLEYEELIRSLREQNITLGVMQRRIEHAQIEEEIARAGFLPTVTASAQYGYNYQSATDGQFESQEQLGFRGGVSVQIPIFTGGRNRIDSQNARATVRQQQLRYEDSEQQLRTRFDNTWHQYRHLENQLATEQSNLEVFERNYERARDSFERGLITGVELRAAQLSLEGVRVRLSETKFQLKLSESTLYYLTGNLVRN